jgi:hypothetical protein
MRQFGSGQLDSRGPWAWQISRQLGVGHLGCEEVCRWDSVAVRERLFIRRGGWWAGEHGGSNVRYHDDGSKE